MGTLVLPNDIEPLTAADAAEVQQNNAVTTQFINNSIVHRDGSKAMTGPLVLPADPLDDTHAATKRYVDSFLPVGVIMPFAGGAAPAGGKWALCNGASLATASYPELFAVCGYRYGGSGGTFKLPNLAGRLPIGLNTADTRFNTTGKIGGDWDVPVPQHSHGMTHNHPSFASGAQSASHTHEIPWHTHKIDHNHGSIATTAAGSHSHTGYTTPNSGGGGALSPLSIAGANADPVGIITNTAPAHSHSVDMPNFVGNSGPEPSERTTLAQSASHTHTVDVPSFTGNTANAGTAGAEHLPPFVVLQYIIRTS